MISHFTFRVFGSWRRRFSVPGGLPACAGKFLSFTLARIIHRVPKRRVAKSALARLYARGPRRHSRALCRGARVGVTQPARGLAALQPAVYELCGLGTRRCPGKLAVIANDFGYKRPESGSRGGTMKNEANNDRKLLPSKDLRKPPSWTLSKSDRRFLHSCNISP